MSEDLPPASVSYSGTLLLPASPNTDTTQTNHTAVTTTTSNSPPRPKRLIWRDIYAEVVPPRSCLKFWKSKDTTKRVVLDQVSGLAEPGEITFIMGSSGAGKTTLLNILTQRARGIRVYGEVVVNKKVMEAGDMRKISAYVQQDDLFIGHLTVRETLTLAARLRMPDGHDAVRRRDRVDAVAQEMGLLACLDTKIGSATKKGISRGEKKRLAFACEALTDPPILFCDEPTSGLDSFMALQVMRALSNLAAEGKTIVCSIHQPSSLVFELADRLILLAAGKVAFQGPGDEVERFLKKTGFPCREYFSVPDHYMAVLSKKEDESETDHKSRVDHILSSYDSSGYAAAVRVGVEMTSSSRRKIKEVEERPEYAASWFVQFAWLFWRGWKCVTRNPIFFKVKLIQCAVVSVLIGILYFQVKLNSETILSYKGAAFNALRDMNFMFLFPSVHVFLAELPVVTREYQSASYHPSAYFMGKNAADSLQFLVLPVIYSTVVYWMAGFALRFKQYMWFMLISMLMAMTSNSIGYAAACLFGNLPLAATVIPLLTIPMMVFGGLYIDLQAVPKYFRPLIHLSWYKYAFDAHMINLFEHVDSIGNCTADSTIDKGGLCQVHPICTCETGLELLKLGGHDPNVFWLDILAMVLFVIAWRALALVALRLRLRHA